MRKYLSLQVGYVHQLIKAGLNNKQIQKIDKKIPTGCSVKNIDPEKTFGDTATKIKLLLGLNLSGDDIADILNLPPVRVARIIKNLIGN